MEYQEFKEIFLKRANKIGIEVKEEEINSFFEYMKELIKWNQKVNLTAIIEPKQIIDKHFIDSICCVELVKEKDKIIDVGSGAGFPGVPIQIMRKNSYVTLIDSINKKVEFMKHITQKLKLKNATTIHNRAEELARDFQYRECYDIAISRAVAELRTLLEYLLPFVRKDGCCICMKGPNYKQEIEQAKNALQILGGEIKEIKEIQLPDTDMKRNIIVIQKTKNMPKLYPRKAGKPKKEPL